MLDAVRSPRKSPFIAPHFWVGLWEKDGRHVTFGGFEATLLPTGRQEGAGARDVCAVEAKLHAAVASIRSPYTWDERWTEQLGTWGGLEDGEPHDDIVDLIEGAHPMPKTFQEAVDEYAYWTCRTVESAMCIAIDGETSLEVLSEPYAGDPCLDLTVLVRVDRLRPLVLHALPARTIAEIETRLRIYEQMDDKHPVIEAAVLRDLAAIQKRTDGPVAQQPRKSASFPTTRKPSMPRAPRRVGAQDPRITAELQRDATQSDRAIARHLGVSQSTVGKERGRLGLKGIVRQVQRGDARPYSMRERPSGIGRVAVPPVPAVQPAPPSVIAPSKPQGKKPSSNRPESSPGDDQPTLPWGM